MTLGVLTRTRPLLGRSGVRCFACMSVEVAYGTIKTSKEDLTRAFETVGKVWDVVMIQSTLTGKPLNRAIVRFYSGAYQPATIPDMPPVLSPPTEAEIREVEKVARLAEAKMDRMVLNGAQIRVFFSMDNEPTQLHEWYEDMQARRAREENARSKDLFPINPFSRPPRDAGDDYRQGFMTGFKLGFKDGSKPRT